MGRLPQDILDLMSWAVAPKVTAALYRQKMLGAHMQENANLISLETFKQARELKFGTGTH